MFACHVRQRASTPPTAAATLQSFAHNGRIPPHPGMSISVCLSVSDICFRRRHCTRPSLPFRHTSQSACCPISPSFCSRRPLRSRSTSPRQSFIYVLVLQYTSNRPSARRLPKDTLPVREAAVASLASLLGGFGVVALFCTAGVYV